MATYMVEVNNHFMVRLEIEGSAAAAEHYFLDGFRCVWGAMAYDEKAMKTECFRGAILNDELITLGLLEEKLTNVDKAACEVRELERRLKDFEDEIQRLAEERDKIREELGIERSHYGKLFERCNCQNR